MTAFMPEPHILLTVVQPARCGMPAANRGLPGGACPSPAGSTQPISSDST